MNSQRQKLLLLKRPTLKQLQALPPVEVVKLPLPERILLPPVSKWDAVKAFFVYSETILIARTEAIVGVLTMAMGSMDYSPLLGITNFTKEQVIWLGGISFIKGLFTELARRRGLKETG
jgi:hypothetical protein